MSFTKYPKNYHSNGYGWHNSASLSYPQKQQSSTAAPPSPALSPYPAQLSYGGGMPALPSQQPYQQFTGMPQMPALPGSGNANIGAQLSYGFAANISPSKIPNVRREDTVDTGPSVGWSIGGGGIGSAGPPPYRNSNSNASIHEPIEAQTEVPCQAVFVPDEDMPIYSFGQPYVSITNINSLWFNAWVIQFTLGLNWKDPNGSIDTLFGNKTLLGDILPCHWVLCLANGGLSSVSPHKPILVAIASLAVKLILIASAKPRNFKWTDHAHNASNS